MVYSEYLREMFAVDQPPARFGVVTGVHARLCLHETWMRDSCVTYPVNGESNITECFWCHVLNNYRKNFQMSFLLIEYLFWITFRNKVKKSSWKPAKFDIRVYRITPTNILLSSSIFFSDLFFPLSALYIHDLFACHPQPPPLTCHLGFLLALDTSKRVL